MHHLKSFIGVNKDKTSNVNDYNRERKTTENTRKYKAYSGKTETQKDSEVTREGEKQRESVNDRWRDVIRLSGSNRGDDLRREIISYREKDTQREDGKHQEIDSKLEHKERKEFDARKESGDHRQTVTWKEKVNYRDIDTRRQIGGYTESSTGREGGDYRNFYQHHHNYREKDTGRNSGNYQESDLRRNDSSYRDVFRESGHYRAPEKQRTSEKFRETDGRIESGNYRVRGELSGKSLERGIQRKSETGGESKQEDGSSRHQSPSQSEAASSQSSEEFLHLYKKCEDTLVAVNAATDWQESINDEIFRQVKFETAVFRRLSSKAKRLQIHADNIQETWGPTWIISELEDLARRLMTCADKHGERVQGLEDHHISVQGAVDNHHELMKYISNMSEEQADATTDMSNNHRSISRLTTDQSNNHRTDLSNNHRTDQSNNHLSTTSLASSTCKVTHGEDNSVLLNCHTSEASHLDASLSFRGACHKFEVIRKRRLNIINKLDYLKSHQQTTEAQIQNKETTMADLLKLAERRVSHGQLEYKIQENSSKLQFLQKRKKQVDREIKVTKESLSQFHHQWLPTLIMLFRVMKNQRTGIDKTLQKSLDILSSCCLVADLCSEVEDEKQDNNQPKSSTSVDKTENYNSFPKSESEHNTTHHDISQSNSKQITRNDNCPRYTIEDTIGVNPEIQTEDRKSELSTPESRSERQFFRVEDCSQNQCQQSNVQLNRLRKNLAPFKEKGQAKYLEHSSNSIHTSSPKSYRSGVNIRHESNSFYCKTTDGNDHDQEARALYKDRYRGSSVTSTAGTDGEFSPECRLTQNLLRGITQSPRNTKSEDFTGGEHFKNKILNKDTFITSQSNDSSNGKIEFVRSPEKTKRDFIHMEQVIEERRRSLESYTKYINEKSASPKNTGDDLDNYTGTNRLRYFSPRNRNLYPQELGNNDTLEEDIPFDKSTSSTTANHKNSFYSCHDEKDINKEREGEEEFDSLKIDNFISKYAQSGSKKYKIQPVVIKKDSPLSIHTQDSYGIGSNTIPSAQKKTSSLYSGLGQYKASLSAVTDYYSKMYSKRFEFGKHRSDGTGSEMSTNSFNNITFKVDSNSVFNRKFSTQNLRKYTQGSGKLTYLSKNYNNSEHDVNELADPEGKNDILEFLSPNQASNANNFSRKYHNDNEQSDSFDKETSPSQTDQSTLTLSISPKSNCHVKSPNLSKPSRNVKICAVRPLTEGLKMDGHINRDNEANDSSQGNQPLAESNDDIVRHPPQTADRQESTLTSIDVSDSAQNNRGEGVDQTNEMCSQRDSSTLIDVNFDRPEYSMMPELQRLDPFTSTNDTYNPTNHRQSNNNDLDVQNGGDDMATFREENVNNSLLNDRQSLRESPAQDPNSQLQDRDESQPSSQTSMSGTTTSAISKSTQPEDRRPELPHRPRKTKKEVRFSEIVRYKLADL